MGGAAFSVEAATKLPLLDPLFCVHAVLQRDAKVPVWDWTEPGAKVTVTFAGQTRTVIAGPDGEFVWANAKIDGETVVLSP